jgi:hypothetical protein
MRTVQAKLGPPSRCETVPPGVAVPSLLNLRQLNLRELNLRDRPCA